MPKRTHRCEPNTGWCSRAACQSATRTNSVVSHRENASKQGTGLLTASVESRGGASEQREPEIRPRRTAVTSTDDVLYALVSPKDLGKYWKAIPQLEQEPDYPMALKGSNTFCTAVGFGIGEGGIPNSISPLHTTSMPSATERKLHGAVERYIKGLRFLPVVEGPAGVPIFTYVVLGRYSYRHGSADGEKDKLGNQAASVCLDTFLI